MARFLKKQLSECKIGFGNRRYGDRRRQLRYVDSWWQSLFSFFVVFLFVCLFVCLFLCLFDFFQLAGLLKKGWLLGQRMSDGLLQSQCIPLDEWLVESSLWSGFPSESRVEGVALIKPVLTINLPELLLSTSQFLCALQQILWLLLSLARFKSQTGQDKMWNIFLAYYLKVFPENKSWFFKGFYLVAVSALKDVHRIHCFEGHLGVTKLILNSF